MDSASGDSTRRIRVCIVLPALKIGGGEVAVLHLLKYLDKSVFDLSVCSLKRNDPAMEEEARAHIGAVFTLGFRWRFFPFAFAGLVRYLRRGRFDIVHTHLAMADALGRIAAWMAGVPIRITTEQGKYLWKNRFFLAFERLLVRITDMRICVSKDIVELRRTREGTPKRKLRYIPNSVDLEKFGSPRRGRASVMSEFGWKVDNPLVVTVGRLVSAKNYPMLMEAAASLRESSPDIRFLVVGEGDCREEISGRIRELGLEGTVTLAGSRYDIPDLVAAADIFALSSLREGTPLSLLEAMAARKPVVGTAVGGIAEVIEDGENGLLVPSGDAAAFAAALRRLLEDDDLRRRLAAAGAATVSGKFSARVTTAAVASIYLDLYRRKIGAAAG